jgi:hypothetical protein
MSQTLEIIHNRIQHKFSVLGDLNFYTYFSLIVFGNCARAGEILPTKLTEAKPSLEKQLDEFDVTDGAILVEDEVDFDPLQDWVETSTAILSKESIKCKQLQRQYHTLSTPFMASLETASLIDFEMRLKAINLLDQLNEMHKTLSQVAAEVSERFPDYKNALNTIKQASITIDFILVDDDVVDPREMQIAIPSTETRLRDFLRMSYTETSKLIADKFTRLEINFPVVEPVSEDICKVPNCPGQGSSKMIMDPFNSELVCQKCGATSKLDGVVFEDSQLYSQQTTASKHKNYKYNIHCEKWLNQLQARENKAIPESVIVAVNKLACRDYTRGGRVRSMVNMRCSEVRAWLKAIGATRYNNNAALIRSLITAQNGQAVIPPQLTMEETADVLYDFSQAMDLYETWDDEKDVLAELGKTDVGNKPYYPYGLMKILLRRLPPGQRRDKLIECIHLQTDATLKRHDRLWERICGRLGWQFVPTNRTVLSTIVK